MPPPLPASALTLLRLARAEALGGSVPALAAAARMPSSSSCGMSWGTFGSAPRPPPLYCLARKACRLRTA